MFMNIVVTENQIKKINSNEFDNYKFLKTPAMTYWDLNGPKLDKAFFSFFSIPLKFYSNVCRWLVEWYGGSDKLNNIFKEYEGKIYKAQSDNMGTYDFSFKIDKLFINELTWYLEFYITVYGYGSVFIEYDDKIYTKIYDAWMDKDIGWQVQEEVDEILRDSIEFYLEEKKLNSFPYQIKTIQVNKLF